MRSLHIDWINCGLILVSAVIAGWAPFALLVVAYVVLGPLHYLTEILWLDERKYFLPQKHDVRWLAGQAGVGLAAGLMVRWLTAVAPSDPWLSQLAYHLQQVAITAALAALVTPLILWKFQAFGTRCLALSAVLTFGAGLYYLWDAYSCYLLFAVLLPTVIHVFVFTSIFMLNGAVKTRSLAGLVGVFLLISCSLCLATIDLPDWSLQSSYFLSAYRETLSFVNQGLVSLLARHETIEDPVISPLGLRISRALAFAYTYHYLNWFSKTSVIGWHRLQRAPLLMIVGSWLICVALYCFDYSLGLTVVGLLSLLHVVYELPLNWLSIRGLALECRSVVRQGWNYQLQTHRQAAS